MSAMIREDANNHYNCPIVTSYSENIKNNVEEIAGGEITFRNPFMSFRDLGTVTDALTEEFTEIPAARDRRSLRKGLAGTGKCPSRYGEKGRRNSGILTQDRQARYRAGRPSLPCRPGDQPRYPELITSYGLAVLTEDSISHLAKPDRPLIVSDQWMYHSRFYAAASYVKTVRESRSDPVQLLSAAVWMPLPPIRSTTFSLAPARFIPA